MAEGTRVFDPTTGLTHQIEEIVEKGESRAVLAADRLGKFDIRSIVDRRGVGEASAIGLGLRGGGRITVPLTQYLLSDTGWRQAGRFRIGDGMGRPRRVIGFGTSKPIPTERARMLGYLIGDGCVTGKTPISFTNVEDDLQSDAARIAASMGCVAHRHGIQVYFSHRPGDKNELLALTRWAGIYGHTAWESSCHQ